MKDGIDHINIFSRGETELGQLLSNFAHLPIKLEEGTFQSIEGYWFYLGTNSPGKEVLKSLYGFRAREMGKALKEEYPKEEPDFERKIGLALRTKIEQHPRVKELLVNSYLPFDHYYVFSDKVVRTDSQWLVQEWETIRDEYKEIAHI